MTALAEAGRSYALLADGTTMIIRPAGPGDFDAVKGLHEAMSPQSLYFRFFTMSRVAAEREARRVCREAGPDHGALLGLLGDELVGMASYELLSGLQEAEIALAVADGMHERGIATLLLEHTVSVARACGVRVLTAEALPDNSAVLRLLADSGLAVRRKSGAGMVELSMPVPQNPALGEASAYFDAVAGRDEHADAVSLEPLLAPRSAAVVGAVSRPGSVGRRILLNIRDAGFAGALHAVDSDAGALAAAGSPGTGLGGIPCVASVAALPEAPDLVVLAVPAARVVDVAQECGKRGARSLVVITLGLTAAQESGLLEASRRAGMRLVGPGCLGVAVPGIGLNATFTTRPPSRRQGRTGRPVRRAWRGAAGAFLPAGYRDLLVRLGRGHAGYFRHRHADVVGGG